MDVPLWSGSARSESFGDDPATSEGTAITSSATANVKGAWVQLIASTAFEYSAIWLSFLRYTSTSNLNGLIDLGVGAAAAEQVLVPNLPVTYVNNSRSHRGLWLPVPVPSGVRIAARWQAPAGSQVTRLAGVGSGGGPLIVPGYGKWDNYGANTADSGSTQVDAGATANTKGAWAELSASATRPIKLFYVGIQHTTAGTITTASNLLLDIGVGAASSEQVLVPNLPLRRPTADYHHTPNFFGPFAHNIAAGSRIVARAQSSSTVQAERELDVCIIAAS